MATLPTLTWQLFNKDNLKKQKDIESPPYSKLLNFYGPPRTIPCRSYQSLLKPDLKGEPCAQTDFSGKIIFIGVAEYNKAEQMENFLSVFSIQEEGNLLSGIDLASVEILATAFANLTGNTYLKNIKLWQIFLLLFLYSIILTFILNRLAYLSAVFAGLCITLLYILIAYLFFSHYQLILPIIIPIFIQLPLLLLVFIFQHYCYERKSRQILQNITGYYIDNKELEQTSLFLPPSGLVQGVCMSTDMQDSTVLAEKLGAKKFEHLMSAYHENIANIIKQYDGLLLDIAGDGTMSAWPADEKNAINIYEKACLAAIKIISANNRFQDSQYISNPTRIGLHAGVFTLSFVKIGNRYFHKASGNTIHIASRIEQLNKELDSQILTSQIVLDQVDRIPTKARGSFLLKGCSQRMNILEIETIPFSEA